MRFVGIERAAALELVERFTLHLPAELAAGEPAVIAPGVVITEYDERFAIEHDAETGAEFVTRVRVTEPGTAELTAFQGGRELGRRTAPWGDDPPMSGV